MPSPVIKQKPVEKKRQYKIICNVSKFKTIFPNDPWVKEKIKMEIIIQFKINQTTKLCKFNYFYPSMIEIVA